MALYVRATCGNCKNKFEIYAEEMQADKKYHCPHCYQVIDDKHWNELVNAFFTVQDLNYQTIKAHNEHHTGLFVYEMVNVNVPKKLIKV